MRLPFFRSRINQVACSVHRHCVLATKPSNIPLQKRKDGSPACIAGTHGALMKREDVFRHLATKGDAVPCHDRGFGIVDDLPAHPCINILGLCTIVIIGKQGLFHPGHTWTFEPRFQATWRPCRSVVRNIDEPESVRDSKTVFAVWR